MRHNCGLPDDTFILWEPKKWVTEFQNRCYRYYMLTDNAPTKEMMDEWVKELKP